MRPTVTASGCACSIAGRASRGLGGGGDLRALLPFARHRRVAGGAGIGLFVCRRLVEAMSGRIWARPRDGGGSEFGFWLPRYVFAEGEEADDEPLARTLALRQRHPRGRHADAVDMPLQCPAAG